MRRYLLLISDPLNILEGVWFAFEACFDVERKFHHLPPGILVSRSLLAAEQFPSSQNWKGCSMRPAYQPEYFLHMLGSFPLSSMTNSGVTVLVAKPAARLGLALLFSMCARCCCCCCAGSAGQLRQTPQTSVRRHLMQSHRATCSCSQPNEHICRSSVLLQQMRSP